jgi:inorganic pyrophosphatase
VAVVSGAIIRCRPVGALLMEDQAGLDEKVIAVPVDDLHPFYNDIASYLDLPQILRDQTAHFFNHYKDLEHGKWTRIGEWVGPEKAQELVMAAIRRAETNEKQTKPFGRRKKDTYTVR